MIRKSSKPYNLPPEKQRTFWLKNMHRICDPVLYALAERRLKKNLSSAYGGDSIYAPLEAFGRMSCGIAPYLQSEPGNSEEKKLHTKYKDLYMQALESATNPKSPDYMVFNGGKRQPLVDAAFLCHAFLRAPNAIVNNMDTALKKNTIHALKLTRELEPWNNNWLLFGAMVEVGLTLLGAEYDINRVDSYVQRIMEWCKGDGLYGDGQEYHNDYYNSFVIHPMLVDIVSFYDEFADIKPIVLKRASRYASILERNISPDGTWPIVGRSSAYRYGSFQLLAQAALQHFLDETLSPAALRCALTAVQHRTNSPDMFDKNGYLLPGISRFQPAIAENYINSGSCYLCTTVFLPLGLPETDTFWSAPNEKWTSCKAFSGKEIPIDAPLKNT